MFGTPQSTHHHISFATFQQVGNVEEARIVLDPLLTLDFKMQTDVKVINSLNKSKRGRFKRRVWAQFQVTDVSKMRIPTRPCIRMLNGVFDYLLLYQWQAVPSKFDLFVSHCGYIVAREYDRALVEFVNNLVGGKRNLQSYSFNKTIKNCSEVVIKSQMMMQAGYLPQHMLIDSYRQQNVQQQQSEANDRIARLYNVEYSSQDSQMVLSTQAVSNQAGVSILTRKGKIFDIHEFARGCIKVLENLLFFTQDQTIRSLQMETNRDRQVGVMRLLDHRQLLQALWRETMDFALSRPGMEDVASSFTQEQIALLYNCNRQGIMTAFNLFALGQNQIIAQPHPVRGLLDHIPFLMSTGTFDFSWYNFDQYGLNILLTAYYLGKNFLSADQFMTSNQGAVCFNGAPGSGKSRLCAILYEFMNGFTFQDSQKGITEFQNYDIVTRSFIKAEEVNLKRLSTSDWKMLADLEVSIKCRIKNQQDVQVTKNVPVVITSNGDVYNEVILPSLDDQNVGAAMRRWGFIRYFDSWGSSHPEIMDQFGSSISSEYQQYYSGKMVNHQTMNALIACALAFPRGSYVCTEYNVNYYAHCLTQFSKTLFGQIVLGYSEQIQLMANRVMQVYQSAQNTECIRAAKACADTYSKLIDRHLHLLLRDNKDGGAVFDTVYDFSTNESDPLYIRCLRLTQLNHMQDCLDGAADAILFQFLDDASAHHALYTKIKEVKQNEALWCKENIAPDNLVPPKTFQDDIEAIVLNEKFSQEQGEMQVCEDNNYEGDLDFSDLSVSRFLNAYAEMPRINEDCDSDSMLGLFD